MRNSVNFLLEDTTDEVRIMEMEYKSIKAAHKAMKSAEGLIQGSSEKDLFEQACEYVAEDVANKLGEMETFMDLSQNFMQNVDLQQGVWDEEGLKMLEEFEKTGSLMSYKKGDNKSYKDGNKVRVDTDGSVGVTSGNEYVPISSEMEVPAQQNQFANFFAKK